MKFPTLWLVTIVIVSLEPNIATSKSLPQSDEEVIRKVANWKPGENEGNPEELGNYFEGDIILPPSNSSRNALIDESSYWPNGIIPYEISSGFAEDNTGCFGAFHKNTCIKFVKRTNSDKDYILLEGKAIGCASSVGRKGGKQIVKLQRSGCLTVQGTSIHELIHVCGFEHEHNREDRDEYIEVKWDNVKSNQKHNFKKVEPGKMTTFGTAYDYSSLMHYSRNAFSKSPRLNTMIPKKNFQGEFGQRNGFAKIDIDRINRMYKCGATTASTGYKTQVSDAPCST